jgi:ABC-2 type transport system permease protein
LPPTDQASSPTGNIYDLGYRRYDGVRLGRGYAVTQLYLHSLRAVFGIGRRNSSKIIPIGLAIITLIPAVIQLGIAAIANNIVEVFSAESYYGYIQWPLALFVSAVAPEVVGRDQRNHTLTLYFSRSLKRGDYAIAKIAAITTGLLLLTLIPQALLFFGNALAGNDIPGYLSDNWKDVGPIIGAGALISLFMAGISLAIAAQTPRRAYATGAILAYWAISTTVGGILVSISDGGIQKYVLLMSGFHTMRGLTFWMFDFDPGLDSAGAGGVLVDAGLDFYWYAVVAAAVVVLTFWLVYRRYQKVAA